MANIPAAVKTDARSADGGSAPVLSVALQVHSRFSGAAGVLSHGLAKDAAPAI
jgi:hypothetical protein